MMSIVSILCRKSIGRGLGMYCCSCAKETGSLRTEQDELSGMRAFTPSSLNRGRDGSPGNQASNKVRAVDAATGGANRIDYSDPQRQCLHPIRMESVKVSPPKYPATETMMYVKDSPA
jgi:hypothetical protein